MSDSDDSTEGATRAERRLRALSGDVLRTDADPVLAALVEETAQRLDAPIAVVSLVLETIQYFRAQHGLPAELAAVRATSLDTAFARRVIDTARVVAISDLSLDGDAPQDLVERYGLRAYLGAPLHLGGGAHGTLEVLDRHPRQWTRAESKRIDGLAARVERRLEVLAARTPDGDAAEPLGEALRSEMLPLQLAVLEARVAALELDVLRTLIDGFEARSTDPKADVARALKALRTLRDRLERASQASHRILTTFDEIRARALGDRPSVSLARLTDGAEAVIRPLVDQVGGVHWRLHEATCPVAVHEPVGIALISTALLTLVGLMLSRSSRSPLEAWSEVDEGVVRLVFGAPTFQRRDGLALAAALSRLGTDQRDARVELDEQGFSILLPAPAQ